MGVGGGGGLPPDDIVYDKTGVMEETVVMVLAKKNPHKSPPQFYARGVQQNIYFYSCGYYGGCGQIGCTKTFEEFGTW